MACYGFFFALVDPPFLYRIHRFNMRIGKPWLHNQLAWLVLILGLLITLLLGVRTQRAVEATAVRQFAYASDQITLKVREQLAKQQALLYSGAGLLAVSESVTREEWRQFWKESKTSELLPGLQGFGFAELIQPDQLQAHIQRIRQEGFTDYTVSPAGPREVYTSIVYLEPFSDRNLRAFGYDMFSEPVRRQAMTQALATGLATLTGPVKLVQEDGQDPQVGVLMYVPAFRQGLPLDTSAQRQAALLGWSYSPYRMDDLMDGMLGDWQGRLGTEIVLSVYDGNEISEGSLLYRSGTAIPDEGDALFVQQRNINFNGRPWLLTFEVGPAHNQINAAPRWWVLCSGTLVSSLLFWLILNLQSRHQLARQLALKLTADIRRQEQRLKEDEFRWNFALDGSGIGVWDVDLATNQVFTSLRSKELLGVSDVEAQSSRDAWAQYIHPEDKTRVLNQLQAYIEGQTAVYDTVYRVQTRDGTLNWLHDSGAVVARNDAGHPQRIIGTLSDVTEQMQSFERVQQLAQINAVISECNAAISHCTTKDQLFQRITQAMVDSGHMRMCWIGLTDPQTGVIHPVHACGHGAESLQGLNMPPPSARLQGQGAMGTAGGEPHPVWIDDVQADAQAAHWRDHAERYGWRSSARLPITRGGHAIGTLAFYHAHVGGYAPEIRSLLEGLARQISFALEKFDIQAEVQAQQKRVLAASVHLQQVLEAIPVPILSYSLSQQRFSFINQAQRRWLGYELDEVATWSQWFPAMYSAEVGQERRQQWEKMIPLMQQGQPVEMPETMLRSKSGALRAGRVRATLVGDEIVLAWTDLTEIRQQGKELQESERRFRSMVENAVTGMYVRRGGTLIYVNDSFCRLLGRSADELLGHELTEFADLSPQEWQKVLEARAQLQAGGRNVPLEVRLRLKDGSLMEASIQMSTVEWDDGQPAVIGLADDITARKRAAAEIDSYVHRLEASMQATLRAVATMVELRDPYTAGHEQRVGLLAADIARELGWPAERCKDMEMIGLVHDIGKIAIPAEILSKPTRLTSIEMQLVREHAQAGYDILKGVPFEAPVAEVIRQHHERMDGSGYPRGLTGEEILPEARVLAVADVLESMAAHRPYRPALGLNVALQELVQGQGTLYDQEVVEAVVRLLRDKAYVLPQ